MERTLVIGGAGFLGSHLVDRLLAEDHGVDVVDDLSTGSLANLASARSMSGELKIHHLDAGSPEADSLFAMRRPQVVYLLAAVPRRPAAATDHAAGIARTLTVLDAARRHGVDKVVVTLAASSMYGRPAARDLPIKERDTEPRGVRGVMSRAVLDLFGVFREQYAVEFTALALANVYGSRQRPAGGVVAAFVEAAVSKTAPTFEGDGRQTRDFVFVDDVVDALYRAGTRGSGLLVNIGTGNQTAIRDLWSSIAGTRGVDPVSVPVAPEALDRFALSPVRARIHLGWSPWTDLADGLAQLH